MVRMVLRETERGVARLKTRSQDVDAMDDVSWGATNFSTIDLGDARRTKRLIDTVNAMVRHPGGTLPDKLNQPSSLRAFYRLMDCEEVTHSAILKAHGDATRRKMCDLANHELGATFLIIHDATELDYTTLSTLRNDLGQIGQGTHFGYICHNSLVVQFEPRYVVGLGSQILHHRADVPKNETSKQLRERQSRESRLWVQGATACGPVPEEAFCVHVSDSLSDTFEYMWSQVNQKRHFLLRARENRKLVTAVGDHRYLFDAIRTQAAVGTAEVTITANTDQVARTAQVSIAYTPVHIAPPRTKSGNYVNEPLELWCVRVWEPNPPAKMETLEWILLTDVAVSNVDEALVRVEWYKCRPMVEEYHKGMKTGCGIETMQFTTTGRMEPAIAVISVIATTLLQLRDLARHPESAARPATSAIDAEYVEALVAYYPQRLAAHPTIRDFLLHVARLGGHQNRKRDGMPGWLTLWRGWMKLEYLTAGRALRRSTRKRADTP